MTLKEILVATIQMAKEIQEKTGVMLSTDNITSIGLSVYIQASKDALTDKINGARNGKSAPAQEPKPVEKKVEKPATAKQIEVLKKINDRTGGKVLAEIVSKGIKTIDELSVKFASELITKFSKTPTATPLPKPTPTKEVPQKTETPTESITEKQIKYLYVLASKLGHGNGQAKDWLKSYFNVASLNTLTKAQAKKGIDALLTGQVN
ncbi:MAG: hypothetical protein AB1349_10070 [Elusimicrobiota bacterium]